MIRLTQSLSIIRTISTKINYDYSDNSKNIILMLHLLNIINIYSQKRGRLPCIFCTILAFLGLFICENYRVNFLNLQELSYQIIIIYLIKYSK